MGYLITEPRIDASPVEPWTDTDGQPLLFGNVATALRYIEEWSDEVVDIVEAHKCDQCRSFGVLSCGRGDEYEQVCGFCEPWNDRRDLGYHIKRT